VFVRNWKTGTTTLASVNLAGTGGGNSFSFDPVLSADGSTTVFESYASDLIQGDYNDNLDVFAFRADSAADSVGGVPAIRPSADIPPPAGIDREAMMSAEGSSGIPPVSAYVVPFTASDAAATHTGDASGATALGANAGTPDPSGPDAPAATDGADPRDGVFVGNGGRTGATTGDALDLINQDASDTLDSFAFTVGVVLRKKA
jgi:hypothetical protein